MQCTSIRAICSAQTWLQRHQLIPPAAQSVKILQLSQTPILLLPIALSLLLAHLLLKYPGSRPLRLALLPITLWSIFYAPLNYRISLPISGYTRGAEPAIIQFVLGMYFSLLAMRAVEWATLRAPAEPYEAFRDYGRNKTDAKKPKSGSTLLPVELELFINLRGIRRGRRARAYGVDKYHFAATRLLYGVKWYFVLDIIDSIMKCPAVYPPRKYYEGGSIWEARHGAFGAGGPWILALCMAIMINMGIQVGFAVLSALVIAIHPNPDIDFWGPLPVYRVWGAESVASLWSRHWHLIYRDAFTYCAYKPFSSISRPLVGKRYSRVIGALATFALSGLIHEFGQWCMSRTGHAEQPVGPTFLFFFSQGLAIVLEQLFSQVTGYKVGGISGWLWTYSFLLLGGMVPMDIWFRYGMSEGNITLRLLQPLVDRMVEVISSK